MTFTLAHLSDVHLAPIHGLGPGHVNLKRALGLANWWAKRRHVHMRDVVDTITADLAKQAVDHIVVSGDLVNLGLPGEHAAAAHWLAALGPPERVSVVPGNHDIYCRLWRDPGVERWRAYMESNAGGMAFERPVERGFPFVRVLGGVALVGLVSAMPTPPFRANGQLGAAQLDALAGLLDRLHAAGLVRVVVIHHPPLPGQASPRKCLTDAAALERVLTRHGAEVVLHGHNHRDMHEVRSWAGGEVHALGIASASVGKVHGDEPLGRYNLIRIDAGPDGHEIDIVTRGLAAPGGTVIELGRRRLICGQRRADQQEAQSAR